MESLGELLESMKSPALRRRTEQIMEDLLRNPLIQALRSEYPEIDDRVIRLNLSKLYQYAGDQAHCKACPGLTGVRMISRDISASWISSGRTEPWRSMSGRRRVPCRLRRPMRIRSKTDP